MSSRVDKFIRLVGGNFEHQGSDFYGEKDFAQHRTDASRELRLVRSQDGVQLFFFDALIDKPSEGHPVVLCPRCQVAEFLNVVFGRDQNARGAQV